VRTLIAGHAALLVIGLDETAYDGVGTIVVRGRAMTRTAPMAGPARGVLMEAPGAVDGEAHASDGPIMVVWSSARREAANPSWGRDVVLHEFSHKLDMLDGTMDGTPPIPDDAARRRWVEVLTAEYQGVRTGADGWLRSYAGTNPAEFFAVATEAFFTLPVAMQQDKPALYDVLSGYYRQDPARRVRAAINRQQALPTESPQASA
jgi:Mlc titration factor MtfA (ptsG expression regulator)